MENNSNPVTPQQVPVQTLVAAPVQPAPQVEVDAQNFKSKIQNTTKNLKDKYNNLPKNSKMLVVIVGVLFAIILLLLFIVILFGPRKSGSPISTPSPTPISVTPAPQVILNASKYATDSGVLKIEDDLDGFQKQLDGSDVRQSDLNIPSIDYNINFNQ